MAHRLTTAQRCDLIAVIDKGQLAEYGTHEQLLAAGGLYTRLWHDSVGSSVPHRQHDITGKSWKVIAHVRHYKTRAKAAVPGIAALAIYTDTLHIQRE